MFPSGLKAGSKPGPPGKPMAGELAKVESIVSTPPTGGIVSQGIGKEAAGPSLVAATKSSSPPKPSLSSSDTNAASSNHKKTFSLVSYSSEDSDSDADQ